MSDLTINIKGDPREVQAALGKTESAMQSVQKSAQQVSTAATGMIPTKPIQQAGQNILTTNSAAAMMASQFGLVGAQGQALAVAMQAAAVSSGTLGGTLTSLKAAVGGLMTALGPIGIAMVALTAVISTVSMLWNRHKRSVEANKKALDDLYAAQRRVQDLGSGAEISMLRRAGKDREADKEEAWKQRQQAMIELSGASRKEYGAIDSASKDALDEEYDTRDRDEAKDIVDAREKAAREKIEKDHRERLAEIDRTYEQKDKDAKQAATEYAKALTNKAWQATLNDSDRARHQLQVTQNAERADLEKHKDELLAQGVDYGKLVRNMNWRHAEEKRKLNADIEADEKAHQQRVADITAGEQDRALLATLTGNAKELSALEQQQARELKGLEAQIQSGEAAEEAKTAMLARHNAERLEMERRHTDGIVSVVESEKERALLATLKGDERARKEMELRHARELKDMQRQVDASDATEEAITAMKARHAAERTGLDEQVRQKELQKEIEASQGKLDSAEALEDVLKKQRMLMLKETGNDIEVQRQQIIDSYADQIQAAKDAGDEELAAALETNKQLELAAAERSANIGDGFRAQFEGVAAMGRRIQQAAASRDADKPIVDNTKKLAENKAALDKNAKVVEENTKAIRERKDEAASFGD